MTEWMRVRDMPRMDGREGRFLTLERCSITITWELFHPCLIHHCQFLGSYRNRHVAVFKQHSIFSNRGMNYRVTKSGARTDCGDDLVLEALPSNMLERPLTIDDPSADNDTEERCDDTDAI